VTRSEDGAGREGAAGCGDAHSGSGYDVAVFPRDRDNLGAEPHRFADLSTVIIEETGVCMPRLPPRAWNERTPPMLEIRTDGIDL
jgi:hypothetical protein